MPSPHPLRLVGVLVSALVACGGSDKPPPPDAPAALVGLGQPCALAMGGADCPDQMGCLGFDGNPTTGMCSLLCVGPQGATMVVDGTGQPTVTPAPGGAGPTMTCTSAYTGGVGTAGCLAIVLWTPMDEPLQTGKTYTDVGVVCTIACGADNACPGTMRCNTMLRRCEP